VLSEILPPEVATAETIGDDPTARLMPGEDTLVRNAVESRRREFVTGRATARRALARLGVPPVPILAGPRREPLWPDGVVGSITHCRGYRAAAVARRADVISVGIDAETHDVLPEGVLDAVALADEMAWIAAAGDTGVHWDRLLFSAKESVFKVWYPLTGRWLDFAEASVRFTPEAGPSAPEAGRSAPRSPAASGRSTPLSGRFTARLLVPGPRVGGATVGTFAGRYLVRDGLALTAVTLTAPEKRSRAQA
jgi:4'-phosphopantetheinyl transferase EntD